MEAIFDFIKNEPAIVHAAFHIKDLQDRTVLWSPSDGESDSLATKFSHIAHIIKCNPDQLFKLIESSMPAMFSCRLTRDVDRFEGAALTANPRGVTVNFLPDSIDKSVALHEIAEASGVDPGITMMAGNDYTI